jgi:hypothetical protein
VQLSNTTLQNADGSSHLLHFRPSDGNNQYYYRTAMTRTQITQLQSKRNANRHRTKKSDKDNKKGGGGSSSGTKKVVAGKK